MGDPPTIFKPGPIKGAGLSPEEPRPDTQRALKPNQPQRSRAEESGAGQQQKKVQLPTALPRSQAELAALQKELERRGQRIEKGSQALMNFLKDAKGEQMSQEALVSTAAMMAALPLKAKEKKRRVRNLYFKWAREKSTVLINKVIHAFRHKDPTSRGDD